MVHRAEADPARLRIGIAYGDGQHEIHVGRRRTWRRRNRGVPQGDRRTSETREQGECGNESSTSRLASVRRQARNGRRRSFRDRGRDDRKSVAPGRSRIALGDERHRSHPAIAEARHRADHALRVAGIAERTTCARQGLAEQGVVHVDAAPHGADQLVAADHALAFFEQVDDAVERLQRQRNHVAIAAQFARRNVELEAFEAVAPGKHDAIATPLPRHSRVQCLAAPIHDGEKRGLYPVALPCARERAGTPSLTPPGSRAMWNAYRRAARCLRAHPPRRLRVWPAPSLRARVPRRFG